MLNYTRIPAPRVTLVDPQTGIISNEWFRFFNNLYAITYSATNNVTPGTYGSVTKVPIITVDSFGAITTLTDESIALDASQIVSGTISSSRLTGSYSNITGIGTITSGVWHASAITSLYGGTGLNTFTAANNALYSTSASALTAGTLPVLAGGTGVTSSTGSGSVVLGTQPTITITSTGLTLQDATDNTKQANFDLSGLTTGTTYSYKLPTLSGSTLAVLGLAQTWTALQTFSGALTVSSGNFTLSGVAAGILATNQTTGVTTIGGTSGTGTLTFGQSTVNQTVNLASGATASGSTKTLNIGANGASGSTSTITIGSTFGSTTTANGAWSFTGNAYAVSGTTGMTNGFFYIPSAAGAPSGTPTAISGRVPMYYDTTNNNFYVYNGAWKKVLLA